MKTAKKCIFICILIFCLAGCERENRSTINSGNSVNKVLQEQSTSEKQQNKIQDEKNQEQEETNGNTDEREDTLIVEESNSLDPSVDYDLTEMNSDMVYSTVYQLMMDPERYVGKTFKLNGVYYSGKNEETDTVYHYCVIKDALACCVQGLEFVMNDGANSVLAEYPEEDTEIEIKGTLETYKEANDDTLYCRIVNAEMKVK